MSANAALLGFLLQSDDLGDAAAAGGAMAALLFFVLWLGAILLIVASLWIVFAKAGQPGWAALIPIYNVYVLLKIAGRPGWWLLLYLIPLINLIPAVIVPFDITKKFGKEWPFGLGLLFLPFLFFPILAFGNAQYRG